MSPISNRLFIGTLLLLASLGSGCVPSTKNGGKGPEGGGSKPRLNGAGATFIAPMMNKWRFEYDKAKGVEVNYQANGSGNGIKAMTAKEADFGCSDGPMTEEQLKKARDNGGEVFHIPLVLGGVVPIYNLAGLNEPLVFTGPVLADIFLGKITKWNDTALQQLNPGVKLPDKNIGVVHRSDGSGTTYIFVDYLAKVSPEWKSKVGVATSVNWPTGEGANGNKGVASSVKDTPGCIGYVELIYALETGIPFGLVKNRAGFAVKADLKSVSAAADDALKDIPEDLRFSLTDAGGPDSYPIAGTSWAIVYANLPSDKGKQVVDFLRWCSHEGQQYCEALHYARLPPGLVERVEKKLDLIRTK